MAILQGDIQFTGTLGNLSAYDMKGVEGKVLRTRGGASKKKYEKSPSMKLTRFNATEFGQCGKMSGNIRTSMLALVPVADYNFVSILNKIMKTIQLLDEESLRGERCILLSRHRQLLVGFSLTQGTAFDSIVRHPLEFNIERAAAKAAVKIPDLFPGVNLVTDWRYPLFRFIINLGSVSDRLHSNRGYYDKTYPYSKYVYTEWQHCAAPFSAEEIMIELGEPSDLQDSETLILSVGIQMGVALTSSLVSPVKYAGAAKILAAG